MAKKRLGRGYGSGKGGHTSGRGQKGQKSRGSVGIMFEGLKVKKSLLHRLPMQRGKSKFKAQPKPVTVKLEQLNALKDGESINIDTLVAAKIVDARQAHARGVKILGGGKLEKNLKLELPASKSVQQSFTK